MSLEMVSLQRRMLSQVVMKGLILVTFFWTDLVNTLPVEPDKNMYETFLSLNSKLKSCSNYNSVSMLESDIFKASVASLLPPYRTIHRARIKLSRL